MWQTESSGGAHVENAIKQLLPPCQVKCPINEDIQRTNVLISLLPDDIESARQGIIQIGDYLYEKNPFFNICGYICGMCEQECNYMTKGGSIKRRLLKRFLSDYYTDYLIQKKALDVVKAKERVAVVGGGPGGLMCAYMLSKLGYQVTIFEASGKLGGALWLVPYYRLPAEVLQTSIDNLLRIARIEVKFNTRVGIGETTIETLKRDGYRAFFLAIGTPTSRLLTFEGKMVEGQDLSGVMYGHDFLSMVSRGEIAADYFKGKDVLVIGGGNVAFDAARTARRLGGNVTIVALETEDKESKDGIPADREEIKGAWEEGIRTNYSRGVSKIIGEGGRAKGIKCPKCISVFDEKGFNPKFDNSDIIKLNGDIVMITVGQARDKEVLQNLNLIDETETLVVDPLTLQSLRDESVYIGGDVRKVGLMVEAMSEGMEAAESIHRYLRGLDLREGRRREYEGFEIPIRDTYKPSFEEVWIAPEKRMHFQMFEKGLTLNEAIEEAKRCLTCGPCISCKACISIGFEKSLYAVAVDEARCSGCGLCVNVCNYYAAQLVEKDDKLISKTDLFRCKSCGMCVAACPADARRMVDDNTDKIIVEAYASLS